MVHILKWKTVLQYPCFISQPTLSATTLISQSNIQVNVPAVVKNDI